MTKLKANELEAYLDEHGDFSVRDNEKWVGEVYIFEYEGPHGAEQYPVINLYGMGTYRLDTSEYDRGSNDVNNFLVYYEPFEVIDK